LILREAVFDRHVPALDIAGFFQASTESDQKLRTIAHFGLPGTG
jgi:hypothetical protein